MIFKLQTKGHKNVTSLHKSTFEVTKDVEIGPTADCIIGTSMDKSMFDFPEEFVATIPMVNTSANIITTAPINPYNKGLFSSIS